MASGHEHGTDELIVNKTDSGSVCPLCGYQAPVSTLNCPHDGTILNRTFEPGYILEGKWEILSILGTGGMGVIYKAQQIYLNKIVAIKTLHAECVSPDLIRRFHQEARMLSDLKHPNLVEVTDFGLINDNQPFMVMQYVEGESLSVLLAMHGSLSLHLALQIFIDVSDAMSVAHSHKLLHRDLKPGNIMVSDYNTSFPRTHVLDFGIAKTYSATHDGALTRTGEILGSPLYMSPEQAQGAKLDERSDIYSLGCVIYETITGVPPIVGDNILDILMKHAQERPKRLSEAAPGKQFTPSIEDIVAKALEKDPARRFSSMADLSSALKRCRAGQYKVTPRLPSRTAIAAGVILCLLIGVLVYFVKKNHAFDAHVAPNTISRTGEQASKPKSLLYEPMLTIEVTDPLMLLSEQAKHSRQLRTNGRPVSTADLSKVLTRPNMIDSAELRHTKIDDGAVRYLENQPIKTLCINETHLTNRGLNAIWHLKNLETLTAQHLQKIDDDAFKDLRFAKNLRRLDISRCPHITGRIVRYLLQCPNLTSLDLSETAFASDNYDFGSELLLLTKLKHLQNLSLTDISLSSRFFAALPNLTELQDLTMRSCNISDDNLDCWVAPNPSLRRLDLRRNFGITSQSIKCLAKLKNLETLRLTGCCQLHKSDLAVLRQALPNCDVLGYKEDTIDQSDSKYEAATEELKQMGLPEQTPDQ